MVASDSYTGWQASQCPLHACLPPVWMQGMAAMLTMCLMSFHACLPAVWMQGVAAMLTICLMSLHAACLLCGCRAWLPC